MPRAFVVDGKWLIRLFGLIVIPISMDFRLLVECNIRIFEIEDPIMMLTAVLIPAPESGFVAFNPETGTTTQGESVEEAVANLREATELYLEEFSLVSSGQPLVTTFQVANHV